MDLDGLGGRCSLQSCRAVDYLPFSCPFCQTLYCGSHSLPAAHHCPKSPQSSVVPTCPICEQPVPVPRDGDVNHAVAVHIDSGCPARVRENKACNKEGCRKRDVTPVTCRACGLVYCLEHRLEADHECKRGNPVSDNMAKGDTSTAGLAAAMRRVAVQERAREDGASALSSGLTPKKKLSLSQIRSRLKKLSSSTSPSSQDMASAHARRQGSETVQRVSTSVNTSQPKESIVGAQLESLSSTLRPVTSFANRPSNPIGDDNVPREDRIMVAVFYPIALQKPAEFRFLNAKHSPGRAIQDLALPPAPAQSGKRRYAMYAVKASGAGVNLLPYIMPLKDAGKRLLDNGDHVVIEFGEDGLGPEWLHILPNLGNQTCKSSVAKMSSRGRTNCVIG